jgi:hypothetical protein
MCVHAAATLLAAAHLARVVDVFPDANLDGKGLVLADHKGPAPTDLKCAWHLGAKQGEMYSCQEDAEEEQDELHHPYDHKSQSSLIEAGDP